MPVLTGTTFSGFTRPTDPLSATDLATKISADISKIVTVVITATDVLVTGATLVTGDGTSIQTSMSDYFYVGLQYGAAMYADDDTTMAANSGVRIPTQRAAKAQGRKSYQTGVLKSGSFIYSTKASTISGVATFYITDDGTATGNAVFINVYADSIAVVPYGTAGNYQPSTPVVVAGNKSITVNISQATNVLGLLTFNSTAANGIDCRLYVMGD